ncbi:Gp19/Gp15/Gp42 family protein [Bifidobacterium longum]|uniref:Gp19/Gp15/Gp42 family protein n=2 Tax=Bifidobacterium longum TaxID=216816 RepID=A0A3D8TSY4_BIFLN|nr:Gp19/Gp15/Gp42 family protein [Bifidobacterium longum]MDW7546097.1 Gp19/Gp15/Gp42 family protein [Bifidobacterium longum]MDW7581131.1 Gp19/Gp15/Gp42 family protein [Bifidobacterium longum]RDX01870.1 hypothetical protein CE169_12030 [Bifidobacterium longum]
MDPSVSFATHSDLEDRWHKLLPEEQAQADILLADASEIIRNRVRPYPETHDPAWWLAHERGLELVCCQMVRTAMEAQVSGGQTGVTQSTETTGPFSSTYSWLSPDGYLRFTDDMLRNLGLSGQRMWSIDMAEGSHHGAC